jgi:hypothetical protein
MKYKSIIFTLALCLASVVQAQEKRPPVIVFGGEQDERASVRVGYWNNVKNEGAGEFAIDYGRPAWKKEYEDPAKFDSFTKGKVWRLGSNFWTVLDSNIPIKIAGKDIPVGAWYVGIHRSEDGSQYSLAFIDPAKARGIRLDPFQIEKAPVAFKVPLTSEKATESKEKLTISLSYQRANPKEVIMKVSWGSLQLSAPIQVSVEGLT